MRTVIILGIGIMIGFILGVNSVYTQEDQSIYATYKKEPRRE